jgi:hypothetical protein
MPPSHVGIAGKSIRRCQIASTGRPWTGLPWNGTSNSRNWPVDDTINGRILNGFHFRAADEHGAWIGKKTAQWIDKHYFGPVD